MTMLVSRFAEPDWRTASRCSTRDYRDLTGRFDKLVSVEMIEAVGERFLDGYLSTMLAAAETGWNDAAPGDHDPRSPLRTLIDARWTSSRNTFSRAVFFLRVPRLGKRYVGTPTCAGSITKILDHTMPRLSPAGGASFGRTSAAFGELGFDERFIRMWDYYLCYCAAGFHERLIGVSQLLFTKPDCRREPILARV